MKKQLFSSIEQKHPWIRLNGPRDDDEKRSAPHIINISFPGLKGEIIVHALGEEGIFVSTGAACHSRAKSKNHVLQAMGVKEDGLESAIRFSLSALTQPGDISYAAEKINETISMLKKLHDKIAPR
jgi:cysteine desulfurase